VIWFYFLLFSCGSHTYASFTYEHFCWLSAADHCKRQLLFPDQLFVYESVRPRSPGCGCAGCCMRWPAPTSAAEARAALWAGSSAVNMGPAASASALHVSSCRGMTDVLQKPTHSNYRNLAQTRTVCVLPAPGSQSRVLKPAASITPLAAELKSKLSLRSYWRESSTGL